MLTGRHTNYLLTESEVFTGRPRFEANKLFIIWCWDIRVSRVSGCKGIRVLGYSCIRVSRYKVLGYEGIRLSGWQMTQRLYKKYDPPNIGIYFSVVFA